VSIPNLISPAFVSAPLTVFELSESQLILPLPDSSLTNRTSSSKIDLFDDSKNFVGNPVESRHIRLLSCSWKYVIESSSLIAGKAHLDILIYTIHKRTDLEASSALNEQTLKKWITFDLNEYFLEEREVLIEYARQEKDDKIFNGEGMGLDDYFVYPKTIDNLVVDFEKNTPKCFFQQGIAAQRLVSALYIPISKSHIINLNLQFSGFTKDTSLPKITRKNFSVMCVLSTTQNLKKNL